MIIGNRTPEQINKRKAYLDKMTARATSKLITPIKSFKPGSDITLLNVIYNRAKKNEDGKYGSDSIDLVYKNLSDGGKYFEHITNPMYRYYIAKNPVECTYNRLCIEKDKVYPVYCLYNDLLHDIAVETNNESFYFDNLTSGNYKANSNLLRLPFVFMADMNIEDHYRFMFDNAYQNREFTPTKLYFDIETDIISINGNFPELGECPVNAITLVDDINHMVYTLLLENYNNPLIDQFKHSKGVIQELKEFVKEKSGGYDRWVSFGLDKFNFRILFFDEEINLIKSAFNLINQIKPDFALAWNIAFDLPYLIERIKALGYDPADIICHPDFKVKECFYYVDKRAETFEERGDYAQVSSYTVYLDQLITFASRRKGQRSIGSYKLDYVGDLIAGVRKLDYSHITRNIAKLPYLDYKTFVFYNIMDTIVQLCIEKSVGDVDFVFTKSLNTNTRYAKVHRQTTYLVNRGIKDFYHDGYIMGCNPNKDTPKTKFPGAYVADPTLLSDKPKIKINDRPVMLANNGVDFDCI